MLRLLIVTSSKSVIVSLLVLFLVIPKIKASSLCQQTIQLIGMTKGDSANLFFYEYEDGESQMYTFYNLGIKDDSVVTIDRWWRQVLTLPLFDDSALNGKTLEPAIRLQKQGEAFVIRYASYYYLRHPDFSRPLDSALRDSISNLRGPVFDRIEEPIIDCPAKLIYKYPGAIYINYEIRDAFFFPGSGTLFIIVHQPVLRFDGDTFHGVLIYKLHPDLTVKPRKR